MGIFLENNFGADQAIVHTAWVLIARLRKDFNQETVSLDGLHLSAGPEKSPCFDTLGKRIAGMTNAKTSRCKGQPLQRVAYWDSQHALSSFIQKQTSAYSKVVMYRRFVLIQQTPISHSMSILLLPLPLRFHHFPFNSIPPAPSHSRTLPHNQTIPLQTSSSQILYAPCVQE